MCYTFHFLLDEGQHMFCGKNNKVDQSFSLQKNIFTGFSVLKCDKSNNGNGKNNF